MIKKIKAQVSRYQQYRCWKCATECSCVNGVNKCHSCGNLCDSSFYMDEITRILKGEEDGFYT